MAYFFWGFIALVGLEIYSIVFVSAQLGNWTFLAMIVSAFIGILMLRNIGLSGVLIASEMLRSKKEGISAYQLIWPIRFAIAALLFISPGFVSTVVALILLLPLKGKPLNTQTTNNPFAHQQRKQDNDDIIDGEFSDVTEKPQQPQKPPNFIEK